MVPAIALRKSNNAFAWRCERVYLQFHVYVSQRDENMNERIQIQPQVCHGKPVIRGTRVLVSTILGALAGGDSIEEVLKDYPSITQDDVRAALEFAGELSRFEETPYEVASS